MASVSPVTVFVAPGPDVTKTTPTLPVDLAYPSAWRTQQLTHDALKYVLFF